MALEKGKMTQDQGLTMQRAHEVLEERDILLKLTELIQQEGLITPDEQARLKKTIRKEEA